MCSHENHKQDLKQCSLFFTYKAFTLKENTKVKVYAYLATNYREDNFYSRRFIFHSPSGCNSLKSAQSSICLYTGPASESSV